VDRSTRGGTDSGDRGGFRRASYALVLLIGCVIGLFSVAGCSDLLDQARALEREGNVAGALQLYSEVIETHPDERAAVEGAAVCLFVLKRFDEALTIQEKLAAMDLTNVQIRVELGFNYLNHQDRPTDAMRVFAEAVKLQPTAKNLCFLAQAHAGLGETEQAERDLRRAISQEPAYAYSYELLVGLLAGTGRAGEAARVIEQAASQGVRVTADPSST